MGNFKLIYGVATSENPKYLSNGKMYNIWYNMIKRCYSGLPCYIAYENCTVVDEWLSFSNFAEWFILNYKKDFEMDKDLLIKGNKIYGPDKCCFVPREINSLILPNKSRRNIVNNTPIGIKLIGKKYAVYLRKYQVKHYLGTYFTIEKAFSVYKEAKELHIKEIAEKWKNEIIPEVYNILINYEINITD